VLFVVGKGPCGDVLRVCRGMGHGGHLKRIRGAWA
jgi:hypothetical protein